MLRRLLPVITLLLVFPMIALAQDEKDKDKDKAAAKKDEPKKEGGQPAVADVGTSGLPLAVYVTNVDANQRFYYWGMLLLLLINATCIILLRSDIQALRGGGSNMSGS